MTDSDSSLGALVAASRERGVTDLAASYLFLRPAIVASLKRHVADRALVERILAPYAEGERFRLRGGAGGGLALPRPVRRAGFKRLRQLAAEHGIRVHVCGCKNPDLASDRCHLTRAVAPPRHAVADQGLLWGSPPAAKG